MKKLMVLMLVLCAQSCALVDRDPEPAPSEAQPLEQVSRQLDPETEALVAAAETGDLEIMAQAAATEDCHGVVICDEQRYSCNAPSAPRRCGEPFCGAPCGPRCPPGESCTRTIRMSTEVFQSCTGVNQDDVCTRWRPSGSVGTRCGSCGE